MNLVFSVLFYVVFTNVSLQILFRVLSPCLLLGFKKKQIKTQTTGVDRPIRGPKRRAL